MGIEALVVGSLVMDLAFRVEQRPEAGELVVAEEFGAYRGGKGYNQAVALARLGSHVSMVGAVGNDGYGRSFLEALEQEGIDAGRVVTMRGTPTAVAVPTITPDGLVSFVQYRGANRYLAPAHCAELPDCDVLLLQDEISHATSNHAARVINKRGSLVLLRLSSTAPAEPGLIEAAGVVVGSERALAAALGREAEGIELVTALATNGRGAVCTSPDNRAAWAIADRSGVVSGPAVHPVDTTASGASFDAALAVALAEGASFEDAATFACGARAYTTTIRGAEPSLPTRQQLTSLTAGGSAVT